MHLANNNQCNVCSSWFVSQQSLRAHMSAKHHRSFRHGDNNNHHYRYCFACHRRFRHSALLQRHIVDLHQPFICCYCGYSFNGYVLLRRHTAVLHQLPSRIKSCTQCGEEFFRLSELRHHINVEHSNHQRPQLLPKENTVKQVEPEEITHVMSDVKENTVKQKEPEEIPLVKQVVKDVISDVKQTAKEACCVKEEPREEIIDDDMVFYIKMEPKDESDSE